MNNDNKSWKKVRLGEVCRTNLNTLSSSDKWSYVKYLDTGNITNNHIDSIQTLIIGNDKIPSRAKRKIEPFDVVFSTVRPNQRHFGIIKKPVDNMIVSTGFTTITADREKILPEYIYYFLSQNEIIEGLQAIAEQAVSTYPSLKPIDLENLEVELPSLEEQERITAILGSLDDKIELNNRMNANLEEQAQALFKRWFVDFEFPNEEGKPYRSSGGEMVESEMGLIPKGWKVGTLGEIGIIVGGGTPSKAISEYYTTDGIAWITPKDLSQNKNKFISKGELQITQEAYKNSSAKLMPRGSVLYSSRAPIGYIAIAKNDLCTNQGFKSVIPNNDIGTPYVYYFLKTNTKAIESKASGSTFKEASGSLMNNLEAIRPAKKVIDCFNEICNVIFHQQERLESESQTLAQLRDSLLPKLMSGELKV